MFTHALVLSNDDGASYEGIVWDRFLKVQLIDKRQITIFDMNNICGSLETSREYKLVICARVLQDLSLLREEDTNRIFYEWDTTVEDVNYKLNIESLSIYNEDVQQDKIWILCKSHFGYIMLQHNDLSTSIQKDIKVGERLCWVRCRWDFLGYAI